MLLAASVAPAQDLESKLDAKEAKLSKVRERSGVLTTTISHYGERIDRLTGEVAGLRNQEAAVEVRLDAKQAELDQAVARAGRGEEAPGQDAGAPEAGPGLAARSPGRDL